jgi:signal transduction histidine kinase
MIVSDLALIDLGKHEFADVIRSIVNEYNDCADIDIKLDMQEGILIKDPFITTQLFRITQEALNNALKHSAADQIMIALKQSDQRTILSVCDNGKGIDNHNGSWGLPVKNGGFGFGNMRYRAHVIGATLEVVSSKAKGSCINCTFQS